MRTDYSLNLPKESASILKRVFAKSPLRTESEICALAFSNDQTTLTIEEDGLLRTWNISTNQEQGKIELEPVIPLWQISHDAKFAVGATDFIHLFDIATGEPKWGARALSWVTALAFSTDGKLLATGHEDGKVRIWNFILKKPCAETHISKLGVSALAFSPNGLELAVACEDCNITLLETSNLKQVGKLNGHKDRIPCIVWSADGSRIYSCGWDTTVRVWNVIDRKPVILLNSHSIQVQTIALSPDGKYLASADSDMLVRIWSTESFQEVAPAQEMDEEVRHLAFSPEGKKVASAGANHLSCWENTLGSKKALPVHPGMLRHTLCTHPSQKEILALNPGCDLIIWNIESPIPAPTPSSLNDSESLLSFALSPDGETLAVAFVLDLAHSTAKNPSCLLALWNYKTKSISKIVDSSCPPITCISFSPCGKYLASGSVLATEVWVYNLITGSSLLQLTDAASGNSVSDVAFIANKNRVVVAGVDWLATSGKDGAVVLWDLDQQKVLHTYNAGAFHIATSPNNLYLACALVRKQVVVLDLNTFEPIVLLNEFQHTINSLAFSPDGKILAAASEDQQIRFWCAEKFSYLGSLGLEFRVKAISFSKNSSDLFVLGNDGYCCQFDARQFLDIPQNDK